MADFSKIELSGSTDGRPIIITATGSPGDIVHTTQSGIGADNYDEIYLYANNIDISDHKLSLQWGGTSDSDLIEVTIAAEGGLNLVIPGLILQNSLVVRAFADTVSGLLITGFVNRITA